MLKRFCTPLLSVSLASFGCSGGVADSNDSGGGNQSRAGTASSGPGGAVANGGMSWSNGSIGMGGNLVGPGAGTSAGGVGAASSGGTANNAGASNGGGAGSGGGGSAGVGGAGGSAAAPTFTMIYDTIITKSCGGAKCHLKRGAPYGYDFSSKTAASASWRADVVPKDGASSPMFQVLNFGIMPKDQPQLPLEQLYLVYDWINAGALDN